MSPSPTPIPTPVPGENARAAGRRGERAAPGPSALYLEVTNRCNLECRTCIRTYRELEPPADLRAADVESILAQMDSGPERAVLQGIGEPLLNPEIFEIVRLLRARGARVAFNTNGTLLDDVRRRRIVAEGPDELRVSLDSATAEAFERVRAAPPRVFEKILDGVRRLAVEARAAGGRPSLSLWIIGVRENESDLVPIVRLARDLGVPEVYLHRLVFQEDDTAFGIARRDESLFTETNGRVDAVVAEAARVAAELGIAFKGSGAAAPTEVFERRSRPGEMPWSRCRRPWTLMYVTANGNVLPCCIAPFSTRDYRGIVLGNVFREPLADIWNGERYRAFRRRLLSAAPEECCSGCGVKWSL